MSVSSINKNKELNVKLEAELAGIRDLMLEREVLAYSLVVVTEEGVDITYATTSVINGMLTAAATTKAANEILVEMNEE